MQVHVIVVNYRTAELAVDCLRSLAAELSQQPNLLEMQVTVVDGASGDDSVEVLTAAIEREGWSEWINFLPLECNGGFAYANNAAIREALIADQLPDYIMLLNPDTIVRPRAVRQLAEFLNNHPKTGIVGSCLENADGAVESGARRCHTPMSEFEHAARTGPISRMLQRYIVAMPMREEPHPCHWTSGAAMMIRREVFEQIGLLDEGYFLYFEEADFCERARAAGWEIWHEPRSCVLHLEGAATGLQTQRRRRPSYWYDSRRRFFLKRRGLLGLLAADTCWTVGRAALHLRRLLGLGGSTADDPLRFTRDLLSSDFRGLIRDRRPARIRPPQAADHAASVASGDVQQK